jgi:hypothetical protein
VKRGEEPARHVASAIFAMRTARSIALEEYITGFYVVVRPPNILELSSNPRRFRIAETQRRTLKVVQWYNRQHKHRSLQFVVLA